jgi:hypothetical protein
MKASEYRNFWREFWHVIGHPFKEHTPTLLDLDSEPGYVTMWCKPCNKYLGKFLL